MIYFYFVLTSLLSLIIGIRIGMDTLKIAIKHTAPHFSDEALAEAVQKWLNNNG